MMSWFLNCRPRKVKHGRKVLVNVEQHLPSTCGIRNTQFCVRKTLSYFRDVPNPARQTDIRQTLKTSATVSLTSCPHSQLQPTWPPRHGIPPHLLPFHPVFLCLEYPNFYQCNIPISTRLSPLHSSSSCSNVLCGSVPNTSPKLKLSSSWLLGTTYSPSILNYFLTLRWSFCNRLLRCHLPVSSHLNVNWVKQGVCPHCSLLSPSSAWFTKRSSSI